MVPAKNLGSARLSLERASLNPLLILTRPKTLHSTARTHNMGSKRKRVAKEANNEPQPSQKRSKKDAPATNGSAKSKPSKALDKSPFTEQPTVEQRKRELVLYDKLGSDEVTERIEAADAIISGLIGGEGVPEPVLLRHLDKRLFRGLASGRNASRLGFSLVLTEILGQLFGDKDLAGSQYPGLPFDKVLGLLLEKTQAGGSGSGQEERDHYFGQLFGIECFVRAGILFTDKARWLSVLDLLLKLSAKKSWLKPQCGYVVVQAVSQMKKKLAEATLEKLAEEGFVKSPEGVGIWIAALDRFPDMKVPAQPWRHPLAVTSLAALPAALKDSGRETSNDDSGNKKSKQGNWTAQLHFVWDLILAHFVKSGAQSKSDTNDDFKQFWNRVVDGQSAMFQLERGFTDSFCRGLLRQECFGQPEVLGLHDLPEDTGGRYRFAFYRVNPVQQEPNGLSHEPSRQGRPIPSSGRRQGT